MKTIEINDYDLLEAVCLCYAAHQKDAPQTKSFYLNQVMQILFGYLTSEQRKSIDEYLAEKKYLPPITIEIHK